MKKALLVSLAAMGLVLTGCGQQGESSTSVGPTSGSVDPTTASTSATSGSNSGTIIRHDSWERVLEYDYSNLTIYSFDSFLEEGSYIYNVGAGKYVNQYSLYGEQQYQCFADYGDSNYVYWPYLSTYGKGHDGWINYNDKYDVDLSLIHQDFYLPALLNNITKDDVEYDALFGAFNLKDASLAKFCNKVIPFGYDHDPEAVTIQVATDENGADYISKVWVFDDLQRLDDGPFMMFQLGYFGTTVSPVAFPELPNESNIYNYWDITGEPYTPTVYPSALTIAPAAGAKTEEGYDIVLDLGESIEVSMVVSPENVNREGIYSWTPDANDFKDYEGNPTPEFYEQIALFDFHSCAKPRTKLLTARKAGDVEIYVVHSYPGIPDVVSNKLKVKVLPEKEQDETKAVYKFDFTDAKREYNDPLWGEASGYYQTQMYAVNKVEGYNPDFDITGYNSKILEGEYTDAFTSEDKVLWLSPTSVNVTAEGLETYVDFNFGDQKVNSLSFKYSLHRSGQLQYAKSNLKEAYLATSEDGVNWTKAVDYKADWLKAFDEASTMVELGHWLQESTFAESQYVRLVVSASYFGQNFGVVFANLVFSADSRTHIDVPVTPVSSVSVSGGDTVRVNNELELSSVITPNNATNKKVYWTSSDHTVAKVTPHKDGSVTVTGLKVGSCKIKVFTDEVDEFGEAYFAEKTITVLGPAELPAELDGKTFSAVVGSDLFAVKFDCELDAGEFSLFHNGSLTAEKVFLTNEKDGIYTFKSANSLIYLTLDDANTLTVVNVSPNKSNLGGIKITELGFSSLTKTGE